MRIFTTLFITTALALTASANVIEIRAQSDFVSECISNIEEATFQYGILISALAFYSNDAPATSTTGTPTTNESDVEGEHDIETLDATDKLADILHKATKSCCSYPITISEDRIKFFTRFNKLSRADNNLFIVLQAKKSRKITEVVKSALRLPGNLQKIRECLTPVKL